MKLGIQTKLLMAFAVVLVLTAIVGAVGIINISKINTLGQDIYNVNLTAIKGSEEAQKDFLNISRAYRLALIDIDQPDAVAAQIKLANDTQTALDQQLTSLAPLLQDTTEITLLKDAQTTFSTYRSSLPALDALIQASDLAGAKTALTDAATLGNNLNTAITAIVDYETTQAKTSFDANTATYNSTLLLSIILLVTTIIVGLAIAIIIAGSITRPLKILHYTIDNMSVGNLSLDLTEAQRDSVRNLKDEIGAMGRSQTKVRLYMTEMSEVASRIAAGDLTVEVKPRSDQDSLGIAFGQMVNRLREMVGEITLKIPPASPQLPPNWPTPPTRPARRPTRSPPPSRK